MCPLCVFYRLNAKNRAANKVQSYYFELLDGPGFVWLELCLGGVSCVCGYVCLVLSECSALLTVTTARQIADTTSSLEP